MSDDVSTPVYDGAIDQGPQESPAAPRVRGNESWWGDRMQAALGPKAFGVYNNIMESTLAADAPQSGKYYFPVELLQRRFGRELAAGYTLESMLPGARMVNDPEFGPGLVVDPAQYSVDNIPRLPGPDDWWGAGLIIPALTGGVAGLAGLGATGVGAASGAAQGAQSGGGLGDILQGALVGGGLGYLGGQLAPGAAAPDLSGAMLDPSAIASPVVPVSTGSAFGTADPFLQGVTQTMPTTLGASVPAGSTLGTAAPFTSGLESAAASAIPGLSDAIQQAATQAGGAAGSGLATGLGGAAAAPAAAAGTGAGTGLGAAAAASALGGAGAATMPNPGPPAATASEIAGTTAPAATGSSLSQYLQSLGLPAGVADLITPQSIGAIGSSLLGVLGSRDQASAYRDTANQFLNMGAPYRDRLAALYANPESYTTGPEMQGVMKAFNQSLSAQYGNPYMSPTATAQSVAYGLGALGKEKDRLAGYGGLGFNPSGVAGLSAQGASNSGTYNALGAGLAQLTQPQNTLGSTMEELLRAQTRRLNTGSGL